MKKSLALILAAMMVAGTASVAFANSPDVYISDAESATYIWDKDGSCYVPFDLTGKTISYGDKIAVEIVGNSIGTSDEKKDVTSNKAFGEWKTGSSLVENVDIQYKKVITKDADVEYTPKSGDYELSYTLKKNYKDESVKAGEKVKVEVTLNLGSEKVPSNELADHTNNIANVVAAKYDQMDQADVTAVAKELTKLAFKGNASEKDYKYLAVVTLKDSTSTKVADLGGEIRVGRTATAAKKEAEDYSNFVKVDLEVKNWATNAGNEHDTVNVYCDKNNVNWILDIEDDADITDIEFGNDGNLALFTVNLDGQSDVNVGYSTKFNADIAAKYPDANLEFMSFTASPVFNRTGDFYLYADEDSYIYEVTADGLKEIAKAEYDEDYGAWYLRTRKLTSYVVSDVELDLSDSSSSEDASSSGTSSSNPVTGGTTGTTGGNTNVKPNPNTGR